VDNFIDKLADLLRNLIDAPRRGPAGRASESRGSTPPFGGAAGADPDLRDAWEELDDYMRGGPGTRDSRGTNTRGGPGGTGRGSGQERPPPRSPADESLRQDYANLEVPFGADIEAVRSSYKVLMMRYHPDKHAGDPEKQRIALEITKKINESFERIRARDSFR
jgi:DnaJ-domain-containing protein 1